MDRMLRLLLKKTEKKHIKEKKDAKILYNLKRNNCLYCHYSLLGGLMEKYQEHFAVAKRKYKIADYMLNVTYPLLRDTKLLLAITENIFLSLTNAMTSVLYFERLYKRIPPFNNTFESKFFMYERAIQDRLKFDSEYVGLIREIKNIIIKRQESPVEFSRRDKFVICSTNYETITITFDSLKGKLNKAKLFIQEIDSFINKNDGKTT